MDKFNFKLTDSPFIQAANGDVIGMQGRNGAIHYFPAMKADNALTAGANSDITGILLNYRNSRVTTVGVAGDSVVLPAAKAGMQMSVANSAAANAMDIFPNSASESINALSGGTALSVVVNKTILFTCYVDGIWMSNLTA